MRNIPARDPFYRTDISDITSIGSEISTMLSSIDECYNIIRILPDKPSHELMDLCIGPKIKSIETAIQAYYQWASGFNTRCELLKGELNSLMNDGYAK
jgi:hypothetical protein